MEDLFVTFNNIVSWNNNNNNDLSIDFTVLLLLAAYTGSSECSNNNKADQIISLQNKIGLN